MDPLIRRPLPRLPVEIIARIIELLLDPKKNRMNHLVSVATVSSLFRYEVERLLYTRVTLTKLDQIVRCFITILQRPRAAQAVRCLTIIQPMKAPNRLGLDFALEMSQALFPRTTIAFSRLIQKALGKMVHLKIYLLKGIRLPEIKPFVLPFMQDFHLMPFKLNVFKLDVSMTVARNFLPTILSLLAAQPSIVDFDTSNTFLRETLPPSILPNIRKITGFIDTVTYTAPKHPVSDVTIIHTISGSHDLPLLLNALAESTKPLRGLALPLASIRVACFDVLPFLAAHFPRLARISLPCRQVMDNSADPYEIYLSEDWLRPLSALQHLEWVRVSTANPESFLTKAGILGGGFFQTGVTPTTTTANQDGMFQTTHVFTANTHGGPGAPNHPPMFGWQPPPPPQLPPAPIVPPVQHPNQPAPQPAQHILQPIPHHHHHALPPGFAQLFGGINHHHHANAPPQNAAADPPIGNAFQLPGLPNIGAGMGGMNLGAAVLIGGFLPPHLQQLMNPQADGQQEEGDAEDEEPDALNPGEQDEPMAAELGFEPAPGLAGAAGAPQLHQHQHGMQYTIGGMNAVVTVLHPNQIGGPLATDPLQLAGAALSAIYDQTLPGIPANFRNLLPPPPIERERALNAAQKELEKEELEILGRWKECCPKLKAVCFEMTKTRYTNWLLENEVWVPDHHSE